MNIFNLFSIAEHINAEKKTLYETCIEEAAETNHDPTRQFFASTIDKLFNTQNAAEIIEEYRNNVLPIPITELKAKADALRTFHEKYFE